MSGRITFLNDEAERMTGYSCAEARGMNIVEVLAPEMAADLKEQIGQSLTRRIGSVHEIEIITKDGRRVPIEVSTRVVSRPGEPVEIEGIGVPSARLDEMPGLGLRCLDADFVLIG